MTSNHQKAEQDLRDREAMGYESWYRRTKGGAFDRREVALVTSEVEGINGLALDVGGGTGRVARALVTSRGLRVVVIDLSEASLRVAMTSGIDRSVQSSVALGLPIQSDVFEVITACQVLQHLDDGELVTALGELRRVIRSGGALVLAGYNGSARRYESEELRYDNGLRSFRRRPERMAELARKAGFTLLRERYYGVLPLRRFPPGVGSNLDRLAGALKPAARHLAGYVVQRYTTV